MTCLQRARLRGVFGGIVVLTAAQVSTRADVVTAGHRPPSMGVTITGIRDGKLHYQLSTGRDTSRSLDDIEYVQIADQPLFNVAEKQQRDGNYRQAINSYERILVNLEQKEKLQGTEQNGHDRPPDTVDLDLRLLVQCRLLRALDAEGRFDRAVDVYLAIIEQMPAATKALQPQNLPGPGSTFYEPAGKAIDAALAKHGSDAVADALARWRSIWPAGSAVTTRPAPSPTATQPEISQAIVRTKSELEQVRDLLQSRAFDQAIETVDRLLASGPDVMKPELYYWRGACLTFRAEDSDSKQSVKDRYGAGLAYMRVVIHYPGNIRAPECLFRAGQLCAETDLSEQAIGLWSELIRMYPGASEWVKQARQAISRQTKRGENTTG